MAKKPLPTLEDIALTLKEIRFELREHRQEFRHVVAVGLDPMVATLLDRVPEDGLPSRKEFQALGERIGVIEAKLGIPHA